MHAIGQIDDAERGFHVLAALRFRELGEQQWKLDVLIGGEHGNQVVHLKYETDVAGAPLGVVARGPVGNLVGAYGKGAGRRPVEPAEEIGQRSVAAAAGPHQSDKVALIAVAV